MFEAAAGALAKGVPEAEFWRQATGTAQGRVISAETGVPIEGGKLRLYERRINRLVVVHSDVDGSWMADGLLPGAYWIWADHPDFVSQVYPGGGAGDETSAVVRPGQTCRGIDFRLKRGGRISGVVLSDGQPVAGADVSVYASPDAEEAFYPPGRYVETDENGVFEIPSLEDGRYMLAAQPPPRGDWGGGVPLTFYPGSTSPRAARWLSVSPGQEVGDLTVDLAGTGTAALRVRALDAESGDPVSGARVFVVRRDTFWNRFHGWTDEDGVFTTDMLALGPFHVSVAPWEQGYCRWSKWVDIERGGEVAEMEFRLVKGAVFEGRLVTQDGSELPELPHFWACAIAEEPELIDGHPRGDADIQDYLITLAEGTQRERFRLEEDGRLVSPPVAPGKVHFAADVGELEWSVVGISLSGRELQSGEEIECRAGQRFDDLEITIGSNLAVVAGRIVSEDSKEPVAGAWAHLRRGDGAPFFALPMKTDRSGSFLFHAVPAGPYVLCAAHTLEDQPPGPSDREITLAPGQVVHMDLVLAPA
jgi:hypothetical protein